MALFKSWICINLNIYHKNGMPDVLMGCGILFLCNLTLLKGLEILTLLVVSHIYEGLSSEAGKYREAPGRPFKSLNHSHKSEISDQSYPPSGAGRIHTGGETDHHQVLDGVCLSEDESGKAILGCAFRPWVYLTH